MAGSSMCPCSACYNSTTTPKTRAPPQAAAIAAASTKASAQKRTIAFQRLRKPRSSDTMASDLVGLRSAAEPIAGSSRFGGGGADIADIDDVELK